MAHAQGAGASSSGAGSGLAALFSQPRFRRPLWVGLSLMFFQQVRDTQPSHPSRPAWALRAVACAEKAAHLPACLDRSRASQRCCITHPRSFPMLGKADGCWGGRCWGVRGPRLWVPRMPAVCGGAVLVCRHVLEALTLMRMRRLYVRVQVPGGQGSSGGVFGAGGVQAGHGAGAACCDVPSSRVPCFRRAPCT